MGRCCCSDSEGGRRAGEQFRAVEGVDDAAPPLGWPRSSPQPSTKQQQVLHGRHQRPLPEGCEFHFFLSHFQGSGGDQVDSLCQQLEKRGFKCWYDNNMQNLTKGPGESRRLAKRLPIHASMVPSALGRRAITQVMGVPQDRRRVQVPGMSSWPLRGTPLHPSHPGCRIQGDGRPPVVGRLDGLVPIRPG